MSGYVYAIGIEATIYVKIGHAKWPQKRLYAMQIGLPFKLELLYSLEVEHPAAVERALHEMLGHRPPPYGGGLEENTFRA